MKTLLQNKLRVALLLLTLVIVGGFAFLADVFIEDNNFRVMSAETIYRSAQLQGDAWEEAYQESPFRSVLNLRGPNPGKPWYEAEIAFAARQGLLHADLALSANKQPDLATTERLVSMMKEAPKPLLIHCKQGADRTGLATALYAYAVLGLPAHKAAENLSLRYGHFPWLWSHTGAMDRAFAVYVAAHPQP